MSRRTEVIIAGLTLSFATTSGVVIGSALLHESVQRELTGCSEEARLITETNLIGGDLSDTCIRALRGKELEDALARVQLVFGARRNDGVSPDLSRR